MSTRRQELLSSTALLWLLRAFPHWHKEWQDAALKPKFPGWGDSPYDTAGPVAFGGGFYTAEQMANSLPEGDWETP